VTDVHFVVLNVMAVKSQQYFCVIYGRTSYRKLRDKCLFLNACLVLVLLIQVLTTSLIRTIF